MVDFYVKMFHLCENHRETLNLRIHLSAWETENGILTGILLG